MKIDDALIDDISRLSKLRFEGEEKDAIKKDQRQGWPSSRRSPKRHCDLAVSLCFCLFK